MLERTAAQSAALVEELRNVVQQAEKLVAALGEDRQEAMAELRERMSESLGVAREKLQEFEEQARHFKDNASAVMEGYIRDNPWTAVGLSTAIGLLLGSWLASDVRRE